MKMDGDHCGGLGGDPRLSRVDDLSGREIAERLGVSRNTVAKALASAEPPRYVRAPAGSWFDPFADAVREL
jgi:predicted DNA-binding protein (UPF0251 family)